jgi:hypothetical protein
MELVTLCITHVEIKVAGGGARIRQCLESAVGIREAAWSKAQLVGGWARVLDNQNADGGVP